MSILAQPIKLMIYFLLSGCLRTQEWGANLQQYLCIVFKNLYCILKNPIIHLNYVFMPLTISTGK